MDTTFVVVAAIIAIVVVVVVVLLRSRLSELSVNGSTAELKAKMEAKAPETQDEKPASVVFKGNKVRGEGEYRMRDANFSDNDVDGKQKVELGYDEPQSDVQNQENLVVRQ